MLQRLTPSTIRRFREKGPDCRLISEKVGSVRDFLSAFEALYVVSDDIFWFRGHSRYTYSLCPSALRFKEENHRERALKSIVEFKRLQEFRFPKSPGASETFRWVQLAQHHGLPTRLLDWTQNPIVALYFACSHPEEDGLVLAFKPRDLNRLSVPKSKGEIFDGNEHLVLVDEYLKLGAKERRSGKRTIAVKPAWNSERIILQQGAFTLHGEIFPLDLKQAPSLVGIPILREVKSALLQQLERIGVAEMFIFPEPEHVCNYLKSKIELP